MKDLVSVADFIGFCGTGCYLISYILVQKREGFAQNILYPAINLLAAIFVVISLTQSFNMSVFVSQLIYGSLSLYGIYKNYRVKAKIKEDIQQKESLPIERLFSCATTKFM